MRRMRVAPSIAVVALLVSALAGCGDVLERFGRKPSTSTSVATPDPASADDPVAVARHSVVKIRAEASSCNELHEGTGFVVAPNRVLTNSHVVAGGDTVTVEVDGTTFDARVVSYDPNADIAILDVPGLSAQPLSLAGFPVTAGTEALMLGYPHAGPFDATPARIREMLELNGPDIYHTTAVTRQVYIITIPDGRPLQGVSGSPLIDMDGRVLGVVFGNEVEDPDTGFALTSVEIAPQMAAIGNTEPVATGACIR